LEHEIALKSGLSPSEFRPLIYGMFFYKKLSNKLIKNAEINEGIIEGKSDGINTCISSVSPSQLSPVILPEMRSYFQPKIAFPSMVFLETTNVVQL